MHAKHFTFFRGLLLCVLILQAAYSPYAAPHAWWLPGLFVSYALVAAALALSAKRFDLSQWVGLLSFLMDIAVTSAVLYATEGLSTDYYVAYFLVILASCFLQRLAYSFIVGGVASVVYLALAFPGSLAHPDTPSCLLRTALLLSTALFSAYIASMFREVEQQAVRRYEERLAWAQRLSMVGRAVSSLLHEIKTPLATIILSAEYLRETLKEKDAQPEIAEQLELMGREAERTEALLEDFLSFAKPAELIRTPVQMHKILDHVCELMRLRLQERNVRLERVTADTPVVQGSERHLIQIFLNLCMNSWQAMPLGGTLTVQLRGTPKGIEVWVADTGTGIAPEQLPALFEPFSTGHAEGHGLGLNVARWIAHQHGGDIHLQSPGLGKGATAVVTLPYNGKS